MRLRFYDPASGRFVSRDPLGLWGDRSQSGSGQGYCGHNPVNRIDPLGLMSDEDTRQLERLLSDHPDSAEAALDYFQRAKREGKLPEEMNELMDELEELEQLETDIAKQDGQLEGRQQLMDEGKDKVEGKPDKEGAKYTESSPTRRREECHGWVKAFRVPEAAIHGSTGLGAWMGGHPPSTNHLASGIEIPPSHHADL